MDRGDGKSIWVAQGERYYLVPDDIDLLPGDLTITSLLGQRRQVAADAVGAYEVSREDAHARIRGRATGFVDVLKNALLDAAMTGGAKTGVPGASSDTATAPSSMPAFEASLETFKSEMQSIAANFKQAIRDIVKDLPRPPSPPGVPVEEQPAAEPPPTAPAPTADDVADAEAASTASAARAAPAESPAAALVESLRAVPAQLEAAMKSPEVERMLREAAAKLGELADRLRDKRAGDDKPAAEADDRATEPEPHDESPDPE